MRCALGVRWADARRAERSSRAGARRHQCPDVDRTAAEEPLEVRLHGRPFAVIMRPPGSDLTLTAGFRSRQLRHLLASGTGVVGSREESLPAPGAHAFAPPVDDSRLRRAKDDWPLAPGRLRDRRAQPVAVACGGRHERGRRARRRGSRQHERCVRQWLAADEQHARDRRRRPVWHSGVPGRSDAGGGAHPTFPTRPSSARSRSRSRSAASTPSRLRACWRAAAS